MKTLTACLITITVAMAVILCSLNLFAADAEAPAPGEEKIVKLPAPDKSFNVDLAVALQQRCSTREYGDGPVTEQELSNLLWAANGVNRPNGKHTSPTPHNVQIVKIYVLDKNGVHLYLPDEHAIRQVGKTDLRGKIGRQPFVATAPKVFLFCFDSSATNGPLDQWRMFAYNVTGCMEQNLALAAAAHKLGGVVVGMLNPEVAIRGIPLPVNEKPLIIMPVGRLKP